MDMKLELVPLPVTDIDRAITFYVEQVGFHLDHDVQPADGVRVTQLTPVGSACSILLSKGLGELSAIKPGSLKGLHLVVKNIVEARDTLLQRGVAVGAINDHGGGVKSAGFSDPDDNSWLLQELSR